MYEKKKKKKKKRRHFVKKLLLQVFISTLLKLFIFTKSSCFVILLKLLLHGLWNYR